VRGALEDGQRLDPGLDLRHELDRRGAAADRRHPGAVEIVIVVPARGVEDLALEAVEPRYVGDDRLAPGAGGRDQHLRRVLACAGSNPPAPARLVPLGREDVGAAADAVGDPVLGGDVE